MRIKWTKTKVAYVFLLALSAIAGSYSGYTWAGDAVRNAGATPMDDRQTVADLDTRYQAAVKVNDAAMMDAILHDEMILVVGSGKVYTKKDLIDAARNKDIVYTKQDEEPGTQTVRVWGDTAVVTALLWIAYEADGKPVDRKLWFSDTYVRTPAGWKYAFGQASKP